MTDAAAGHNFGDYAALSVHLAAEYKKGRKEMKMSPDTKRALAVKPVLWSLNSYQGPSSPKVVGGFVSKSGYGNEEWNNDPLRVWKGMRYFHTESESKLDAYADHSNLALLMIAMHHDTQYLVGLACAVQRTTAEDMKAAAQSFRLADTLDQLWAQPSVKRAFSSKSQLKSHRTAETIHLKWKCPTKLYHWFDEPVAIPHYPLRDDKMVLAKRHGGYQGISPDDGLTLLGNSLPLSSPARRWLLDGEFDEAFLSAEAKGRSSTPAQRAKKFGSASAAVDPYVRYLKKRALLIDPQHGRLEARFREFLEKTGHTEIVQNDSGIDIHFVRSSGEHVIAELKPAKPGETRFAIRMAIGQVLEYSYLHGGTSTRLVVIGAKPSDVEIQFVQSLSMALSWEQDGTFHFIWPGSKLS